MHDPAPTTTTTTTTTLRTAMVGLGQMGAGIARNLDRAGLLVGAFDADPTAFARAGLGAAVADAPVARLRGLADVLLFAVPDTSAIRAALGQSTGPRGQILIDLTTSDPADSMALARDLGPGGQHYLDAAMTGGAAGADEGRLTLMIGGDEQVISACSPILQAIAATWFHLGPVGSGHAMKLVHNMILHSSFMATCEGLQMAVRAGLDVGQAVDVLNAGNARSFVTEVRFPRDILSGTMNARSQIANLAKDLGLATGFAARLDARAPYGALTDAILGQAMATGQAACDFSNLYPEYENLIDRLEEKS